MKAKDDDVMFVAGKGDNPARDHARWLQRFFQKKNEDVQSHDFRTTKATDLYKVTKDPEYV